MKTGSFDDGDCSISHVATLCTGMNPTCDFHFASWWYVDIICQCDLATTYFGGVGIGQKEDTPIGNCDFPSARFKTQLFASRKSKPRIASAVIRSAMTNLCLNVIPEIVIGIIADPMQYIEWGTIYSH